MGGYGGPSLLNSHRVFERYQAWNQWKPAKPLIDYRRPRHRFEQVELSGIRSPKSMTRLSRRLTRNFNTYASRLRYKQLSHYARIFPSIHSSSTQRTK